jgi:hypothetical protein
VPALLIAFAVLLLLARGIEWGDEIGQSSSPAFRSDGADFEDFDALASRLALQANSVPKPPADTDRVSAFIWKELSDSTRAALTSKSSTSPSRRVREALLAADFNRMIESGYSIYTAQRFPTDAVWLRRFSLRLQEKNELGAPSDTDSKVIVVQLREPLTFRVIEWEATPSTASVYFDLRASELSRSDASIDSIRKELRREELEPFVDKPASVPAGIADSLLTRIFGLLGYTGGLGPEIEGYLRTGKLRSAADDRWLNRLLLERAYAGEIKRKPGAGSGNFVGVIGEEFSRYFVADIPVFLRSQAWTVWILGLFALIPGLAGLIFRRAFRNWFVATFVILFSINVVAAVKGWGHVGASMTGGLIQPYGDYVWVETLLILLVLAFRLQRHSAAALDARTRRFNVVLAGLLTVAALGWIVAMKVRFAFDLYAMKVKFGFDLYQLGTAAILLLVARALFVQTRASSGDQPVRAKNIVVCLDGTWNQPGTKDFGHLADTNVFKLFRMLKGTGSRAQYNSIVSKEYVDESGSVRQVAFYYHGVGNTVENSELGQVLGGVFGMGADAIVERAYLDIVRVYKPGDRIFIFGFSRGAAIARMLTGVIGRRDIPKSLWTLRLFGRHWLVRKSAGRVDERAPVAVDVLGCWDTVGAFGLAKNILGIPFQRINLLKDLGVSLCVKRAYHMVALDETRDAFEPTLMEPDPTTPDRVIEVWFSGNHANVGGGYATDELSDVSLDFLLRNISSCYAWRDDMQPGRDESWGLCLSAARRGVRAAAQAREVLNPDPRGQLRQQTGPMYAYLPRTLPMHAVIHDTVFERLAVAVPVYAPKTIFALNERVLAARNEIEVEARRLVDSGSMDGETATMIRERSAALPGLMTWSKYLEAPMRDGVPLKARLRFADELSNAI